MTRFVLTAILLSISACATGVRYQALQAEADLPRESLSFHPLGSDAPLARSSGQWARYRERVGVETRFVTVSLYSVGPRLMVRLRRDRTNSHEERSLTLDLAGQDKGDPLLRALRRAAQFKPDKPRTISTRAGTFVQARKRGGLSFHPRVPVFGLVSGRRGLYRIELVDFGLNPAP